MLNKKRSDVKFFISDLFYYVLTAVKRSETKTTRYACEIKSLKQGISPYAIILGVQANKIERRDALWQIVYHTQNGYASII